jgi:hypothetical protein
MSSLIGDIQKEIQTYLNKEVEISEVVKFSQSKLVKRISLFENRTYPKGKVDEITGAYKYWYDIITPRVNNEIKNLRIDTKNPLVFSKNPVGDFAAVLLANSKLGEWMWQTGKGEEINSNTEEYSAKGNLLLKKTKDGFDTCDPSNTYIVNQTAKTVDETSIIERHLLTQSELRAKEGVWDNVDTVLKECKEKSFSKTIRSKEEETTNAYYEIFERNGEVNEQKFNQLKGIEGGDENKYILARIIVAGLESGREAEDKSFVLFAEPLSGKMSDYYIEAHRGPYKGRWWREGLYELLFDYQVRANEIGNQLAQGLEWASKAIFKSADNRTVQNIITDIANGDIVKSADLSQVDVRMQGLDQLIADWNRLIVEADNIANSYEVVTGEEMKTGTPFRLGLLMDTNANKLFLLLRQKLGLAYDRALKEWILPQFVQKIKGEDIIRLTGSAQFLDRFRQIAVNNWYVKNLVNIGPHGPEIAQVLKEAKMMELAEKDPMIKNSKEIWKDVLPRLYVTVTGENVDFDDEYETIQSTIQLETDPIRRAFLLDRIYAMKGLAVPPPVQPNQEQVQPSKGNTDRGGVGGEEDKGVREFKTLQTGVE